MTSVQNFEVSKRCAVRRRYVARRKDGRPTTDGASTMSVRSGKNDGYLESLVSEQTILVQSFEVSMK